MKNRSNNLQMMRFFAAALVILSHAYPIVQGSKDQEWLYKATNGQLTFGGLAVAFFFFVGGFFAASSVEREKSSVYIKKRIVRLIPTLAIVTLLCIGMGAFITELTITEYFRNSGTWLYLLNACMIPIHNLPGVFLHQPYATTVNGALWTLPLEFMCYIACLLWFRLGLTDQKRSKWGIGIVGILLIATYYVAGRLGIQSAVIRPCGLFFVGMVYRIYQGKILQKKDLLKNLLLLLSLIALIFSAIFGGLEIAMHLAFPYIIYYISFAMKHQIPKKLAVCGNLSYAMYLVGFPIQQLLVSLGFTKGVEMNFTYSLFLDIVIAIILTIILFWLSRRKHL